MGDREVDYPTNLSVSFLAECGPFSFRSPSDFCATSTVMRSPILTTEYCHEPGSFVYLSKSSSSQWRKYLYECLTRKVTGDRDSVSKKKTLDQFYLTATTTSVRPNETRHGKKSASRPDCPEGEGWRLD